MIDAVLTHGAKTDQSAHKVDGIAPTLNAAYAQGVELELAYTETLDVNPLPASGDFAVTVDGNALNITGIAARGDAVTLTLAAAVTAAQAITLTYTPGTNPIRDFAGNRADALTNEPVTTILNVCDRTEQVRDAIMAAIPVNACSAVTDAHLAAITHLSLSWNNLSSLQAGDFSGMPALRRLYLTSNALPNLPEGVFAGLPALEVLDLSRNLLETLPETVFSGLARLKTLNLSFNALTSLPEAIFDDLTALKVLELNSNELATVSEDLFSGLAVVQTLDLSFNALTSLSEAVLDDLTELKSLELNSNQLETLPDDIFSGLASVQTLDLSHNALTSLPANVFSEITALESLNLQVNALSVLPNNAFSGLTALVEINLGRNELSRLSADVFSGLISLQHLDLGRNRLSALPDGVFSGLASLNSLDVALNPVDPLPIAITLESAGTGIKALVHTGAPFEMALPVGVVNGELAGGAESISIPRGSVESTPLTASRFEGVGAAVTVDIKRVPTRPTNHVGYILVTSPQLPLEAIAAEPVTVYPTALTMPEGGSNAYTVVLNLPPTGNVTVAVTVPQDSGLSAAPMQLTFTEMNHNDPQTITVTAQTDVDNVDDDVTLSHTVTGSGDYDRPPASGVAVLVTSMTNTANGPPAFTSGASFETEENGTAVGRVTATDADAVDYTTGYKITGGADRARFTITRHGALSFTEVPDYERPTDLGMNRMYAVEVTATSGTESRVRTARQSISVTIEDVMEPPGTPPPPTLTVIPVFGAAQLSDRQIRVQPGGTTPNTGPEITRYETRYHQLGRTSFLPGPGMLPTRWADLDFMVYRGLSYAVQVRAVSDEGRSEWSPSANLLIRNAVPTVDPDHTFDPVLGTVGGMSEVVYLDYAFDDADDGGQLRYTATSTNSNTATVRAIGPALFVQPVAAGTVTVTVTATDPLGESATTTFDATVQAATLPTPAVTIEDDSFSFEFTDSFEPMETRAYQTRIRQRVPAGHWATGCLIVTNSQDVLRDIPVSAKFTVPDFFEAGTAFEADYSYRGTDCDGSVTTRSPVAGATTSGTASFSIELVFVGTAPSTRSRSAFEAAAQSWEETITHGVPSHTLSDATKQFLRQSFQGQAIPDRVDDLLIYAQVSSIDGRGGTLGTADMLVFRSPSRLPVVSEIRLDMDDLDSLSDSALATLILHEIGHALGIGTIWVNFGAVEDLSLDAYGRSIDPRPDTHFNGPLAIAAFDAAGGAGHIGAKVPVENAYGGPGNRDAHWRESVLDNELMTPTLESMTANPRSAITIQSLADLGYLVDVGQADTYTLPTASSSTAQELPEEHSIPLNCILTRHTAAPERFKPIILQVETVIVDE